MGMYDKEKANVTLSVTKGLVDRMKAQAEAEHRTLSGFAERVIEIYLDEHEGDGRASSD